MIPTNRRDVLDTGLRELEAFASRTSARGRFVALYLGLRRMGAGLAGLDSVGATAASELEQFLDNLYTKTHRAAPYVVLTAPFGQSTSPSAPYSTRTGEIAPGNRYATNTWRNNFGIQKGVGCPAEADVISSLLDAPGVRLACPHMSVDSEGRHVCGIQGTTYRGEEHSIWLRITSDGYRAVPLDHRAVYSAYLTPSGQRIPIFPLMAVLYSFAPTSAYPARATVGIPEFAADFGFTHAQVQELFDCDPDSSANTAIIGMVQNELEAVVRAPTDEVPAAGILPEATPLPALQPPQEINSGVGAELAVAADLNRCGWTVAYRGNQRSIGYDLEGRRDGQLIRVEVKSSIGFTTPELTEAEWIAAQRYADEYILAVVDFYGSPSRSIWYVRNPAVTTTPVECINTSYRLPRIEVEPLKTDADFL